MVLNLDLETNLEADDCRFSQLNEVFEYEYGSSDIFAMGFGFGRWLEKQAIRLEKKNMTRRK